MFCRSFDAPIRVQRQYDLARSHLDNCCISGVRLLIVVNVAQCEFSVRRFTSDGFMALNRNSQTTNAKKCEGETNESHSREFMVAVL
jgi:hypothetical protein